MHFLFTLYSLHSLADPSSEKLRGQILQMQIITYSYLDERCVGVKRPLWKIMNLFSQIDDKHFNLNNPKSNHNMDDTCVVILMKRI